MTDEEFRKEWIKALRSGDYKQGESYLRDEDRYCCIGVACDIHPEIRWKEELLTVGSLWNAVTSGDEYNGSGQLSDPYLIGLSDDAQDVLIALNDEEGFTFSEIADVLEAKLYDKTGVVI